MSTTLVSRPAVEKRGATVSEFSVKPVYKQVEESLSQFIHKRRLRPGQFLPPESELTEIFGVSRVTLRKGMQGLIRAGVLQSQPGLGHLVAQARAVRKLALIFGIDPLAATCPPFFRLLSHALRYQCGDHSFDPAFLVLDKPRAETAVALRTFAKRVRHQQFSAAILLRWGGGVEQAEELLVKAKVPVLNCTHFGTSPWRVTMDVDRMISEATRWLLHEGKRRIALLPTGHYDQGYAAAYRELGLTPPKPRFAPAADYSVAEGYALARRILQDKPAWEAVIVPDDFAERGVNAAVLESATVDRRQFTVAHFAIKGDQFVPGCRRLMLEFDPADYAEQCFQMLDEMLAADTPARAPRWIRIAPTLKLVE